MASTRSVVRCFDRSGGPGSGLKGAAACTGVFPGRFPCNQKKNPDLLGGSGFMVALSGGSSLYAGCLPWAGCHWHRRHRHCTVNGLLISLLPSVHTP